MVDFRYGPVEMYLVGFEGDRPDPGVISALVDQLDSGLVRLLDFVIISKSAEGEVTVTEIEEETEAYGFGGVELAAIGLAGGEDVDELAELIEPGTSAALVSLELLYARTLASRLAASGAVVLSSERIPAPVVNAILDAEDALETEGASS